MSKPTDVPESTKPGSKIFCSECNHEIHQAVDGVWVTAQHGGFPCGITDDGKHIPKPAASPVAPESAKPSVEAILEEWAGGGAYGERSLFIRRVVEGSVAIHCFTKGGGLPYSQGRRYTMNKLAVEELVKKVRQRIAEGDCPTTPALTVEMLENLVDHLASPVAGGSADEVLYYDDFGGRLYLGSTPFAQMLGACNENTHEDARRVVQLWNTAQPEGWVKVTPETMPEMDGTWYLVLFSGYTAPDTRLNGFMDTYSARNQDPWRSFATHGFGITHYQPLPAPPAAEEERSSL